MSAQLAFRALVRLRFPARRWAVVVAAPLAFDALLWINREAIAAFWAQLFGFWVAALQLPAAVHMTAIALPTQHVVHLPTIVLAAALPGPGVCLMALAVTLCVLAWSSGLPESATPLVVLLRLMVLLQAGVLLCFLFYPGRFTHTIASHTRDTLTVSVVLLLSIPWLHALTYYVFDFCLWRKVALTTLTLVYFLIFAPMRCLAHAWLVHHCTLVVLPLLYLFFGYLIDMLALVALYAWAMSWPRVSPLDLPASGRSAR